MQKTLNLTGTKGVQRQVEGDPGHEAGITWPGVNGC